MRRTARRLAALSRRHVAHIGIALLGLGSVVLVWASVAHIIVAQRGQAVDGAYLNATNLARAFEENVVRSIGAIDQNLLYVRDEYTRDPKHFDISGWTSRIPTLADITFQIAMIDKHGMMRGSNLTAPGAALDLSDREHFRVHVNNPQDELFISKPVLGRASKKWSIQFTRKIFAPDGSFDGVVVASLDPGYLSRFYSSVDLGRTGVVVLLGTDGYFRARAGIQQSNETVLGRSGQQTVVLKHYAQAPVGTFAGRSTIDGIDRFYAYRKVSGYPLVLSVAVGQAEVLAPQLASRRTYLLVGVLITCLVIVITVMLLARQTQMARAREAMRAQYAQKSDLLEATLENMSQGIMMVDADRRIQVCSRRLVDMLDLPDSLLATRPHFKDVLRFLWFRGEFGTGAATFEEWLSRFKESGTINETLWIQEHTRPDGVVLEVRVRSMPDGRVVRTYTDITARKQNETALRAALDEADRATRAKSVFLATMSHEIRSPMSGLLGVHDLLRATKLDADQRRMADMVHDSALMLLAVLNDILDFSKIEAGAMSVAPEPVELNRILKGVVEPHAVAARDKNLTINYAIDPELPAWLMIDGLRLRQIISNLISNAVKFTTAGQVTLTASLVTDQQAPQLQITVRDSGIGMSLEVLSRLFEPFTQADGSTTRNYGGTGLGLSISRKLARLLGGDLSVTSEPGVGSEFSLILPLVATTAAPVGTTTPVMTLARTGRVLVADDDPTNRWLAQRQLQQLGYEVDVACDGKAALAALQASRYDLLMTDCHMPHMDGVALACAVRAASDPDLCALPIIGVTADTTQTQRDRCNAAGMNELAIKPLSVELLRSLLSRVWPQAGPAPSVDAISPVPPTLQLLPFDPQIYLEIFPPGDPDGAIWLNEYMTAARQDVDELACLVADHPEQMARVAHRLAGASFSVGAMLLGQAARTLELAAKADNRADLPGLQHAVRAELRAAEGAITEYLTATPEPLFSAA